jgi:PTH1 family peptidyl-tRNA hydrolase
MNESGRAVERVTGFYRVPTENLLVVVDDAELPLGLLRMRPGGSSGGHHGLESVERHLGTRDFARLRLGIGRRQDGPRELTRHVLGRFCSEEQELLEQVLERASAQMECWLVDGIGSAMNRFNGAIKASNSNASE